MPCTVKSVGEAIEPGAKSCTAIFLKLNFKVYLLYTHSKCNSQPSHAKQFFLQQLEDRQKSTLVKMPRIIDNNTSIPKAQGTLQQRRRKVVRARLHHQLTC